MNSRAVGAMGYTVPDEGRITVDRGKWSMSQAAALFIAAQENAVTATTAGARNYHLGQRDAFEAVFRACFGLEDDDVTAVARDVLAALPSEEREALMDSARDVLRARRRVTRDETLKVV